MGNHDTASCYRRRESQGTRPGLDVAGGDVFRNNRLRVGYFAQHQAEELDLNGTPLMHMQAALPKATETACRAQLARFGLDADRADTRVAQRSGGEKARLMAMIGAD